MFDRAMTSLIAATAACAAAAMAVFALGFALYALIVPTVGAPGAAAIVALVAALLVALYALFATLRARKRERETAVAQAELLDELPTSLGDVARDRPLMTLGVTLLGGLLAARHPTLVRDVIHIVARFSRH